jgi:hypothetical protein
MIDELLHAASAVLSSTALSDYMRQSRWMWTICESLHFIGMSLLIGTVGLFDLRLMGFAKGVPVHALHRLIPIGIAGFTLNLATGICFITGTPDQYFFNAAFRIKLTLIIVAGFNVLFFYGRVFSRLQNLSDSKPFPLAARIAGAVSISAWIGVMSAGRLLTFFRPPF